MTNEQLIQRIILKDESAFDQLYETYHKLLYYIIYQILGTVQETEEVLQEVFMKIYNSIHTFKNGNFKYWMTQIARNTALTYATRDQKKNKKVANSDEILNNTQSKNEGLERIDSLLKSHFSEEMRQVVLYRAIFDFSYKDIAEMLEKDVKHITKVYKAAIPTLKLIASEVGQ
jgi:RNA polymerase sigma-70 factor (ECF subfamily)